MTNDLYILHDSDFLEYHLFYTLPHLSLIHDSTYCLTKDLLVAQKQYFGGNPIAMKLYETFLKPFDVPIACFFAVGSSPRDLGVGTLLTNSWMIIFLCELMSTNVDDRDKAGQHPAPVGTPDPFDRA